MKAWDSEAKEGPLETGFRVSPDELLLPSAPLDANVLWTLRAYVRKSKVHARGKGDTGLLKEKEDIIYFLHVGILGEVPGEVLNRIFIRFPGWCLVC